MHAIDEKDEKTIEEFEVKEEIWGMNAKQWSIFGWNLFRIKTRIVIGSGWWTPDAVVWIFDATSLGVDLQD